jgi:uncharacterized protein
LHEINCLETITESLTAFGKRASFFTSARFDTGSRGPYHARAMGNPLRDRRTPREFAASGQTIDFEGKISDFERLAEIVEADLAALDAEKIPRNWRDRRVAGHLSFGFADAQQGLPTLEGSVAATVDAVCQRCLEPMELALSAELKLLFASDPAQATDDSGFEVWELDEETLCPLEVVDEVLAMAVPLAVLHENDESCRRPAEAAEQGRDTIRPFAALKAQMEQDN